MFDLVGISDPIIDTHVQIASDNSSCSLLKKETMQLCLDYGQKIPIMDSFQSLGGNAPNVAVAIAKLGLSSALVATVGADAYGKLAKSALKAHGVDTNTVSIDRAHKTRYSIVLNYCGERTILSYSDAKRYAWPKKFPKTNWIYYGGLSEGYAPFQEQLFSYLDQNPIVRLVVNPGSYMLKFALSDLRAAAKRADILIVNLEEAEIISGQTLSQTKSMGALMHSLLSLGAKEVVITDGGRGSWAATGSEAWHLEAYPVPVIAKTGAGDAFSAGYIAARQAGHDIAHALEWGTANSSGVIGEHGPHVGLLDRKGITNMIAQFSKSVAPTSAI